MASTDTYEVLIETFPVIHEQTVTIIDVRVHARLTHGGMASEWPPTLRGWSRTLETFKCIDRDAWQDDAGVVWKRISPQLALDTLGGASAAGDAKAAWMLRLLRQSMH